jgi:hypothetical protein
MHNPMIKMKIYAYDWRSYNIEVYRLEVLPVP